MPFARARAHSLHIPIPTPTRWGSPHPSTLRPVTFPKCSDAITMIEFLDQEAPPVPPVSYWEPDTPESPTVPLSPRNPFLSPPPRNPKAHSLVLPPIQVGSPLSLPNNIFDRFALDRFASPSTPSFLIPRRASVQMSPRFLYPRIAPVPPPLQSKMSELGMDIHRKRRSTLLISSQTVSDLENMQYQSMHEVLASVRDQVKREMERNREDIAAQKKETRKCEGEQREEKRPRTRSEEREWRRRIRQKKFTVLRDGVACS
jgi:hypothetical protein